ncbi:MAG: double zinc ribbon domain-containing protein [Candidatus Binatia bacterium]
MKCPSCQRENPPENAFCAACGARIAFPCAACGRTNPVDHVFRSTPKRSSASSSRS